MSFISASVTTDPTELLDTSIDQINSTLAASGLPGWSANDATLAVLILSACAQMAADVAQVAATMLPALFRALGTQLFGIAYQNGTSASVQAQFTFTSAAPTGGYTIPAQTTVVIDNYAFYTQADYTSGAGDTTATLTLVASQTGTAYNNLGAASQTVALNDGLDFVSQVMTLGVTSGGTDQETDSDYQNRLAGVLALQAPRPIIASDYAAMVLSDIAGSATGVVVGRATAFDNYYPDGRVLSTGGSSTPTNLACSTTSSSAVVTVTSPSGSRVPAVGATVTGTGVATATFTANTTSGSTTLASVSSFASVGVGTKVSGAGIPVGASIVAINTGASTATLSIAATATGAGVTITPTQTVVSTLGESQFTMSAAATATGTPTLTVSSMAGYGPVHLTATVTLTSGSPTVSITTPPYYSAIPDIGARVRGTGIPSGATVLASPAPTTSSFTLSANATASGSQTVSVSSWTSVQRCVTTFVTDSNGLALSAASMDALQTWLAGFRETSALEFVTSPSYTTIYVSVQIHVLPGYTASAVTTNVQSAILAFLSSATWGNPNATTTGQAQWLNTASAYNVVRLFDLVGVVKSVPGVQYIPDNGITLGTSPSPAGTADITLTGPAPLPLSSTSTISVTTV